ncbi:gp438 [Bacillus phage G]|uniref:Gp438 n=1 Tax=Bacillus phage G TaxID=2884420 RepID=G3MAH9_9CAUD|nr:gp438 [Bacillus phage G]AEO93696.1 gp438 [Bacillus phage G]
MSVEIIKSFLNMKSEFYLIEDRVYVKNYHEKFYEFLNVNVPFYQLRAGDIIEFNDIKYCEDVIQLTSIDVILQYIYKV